MIYFLTLKLVEILSHNIFDHSARQVSCLTYAGKLCCTINLTVYAWCYSKLFSRYCSYGYIYINSELHEFTLGAPLNYNHNIMYHAG